MKPQVVAHELDRLLAHDAIVATDSGTNHLLGRALPDHARRA